MTQVGGYLRFSNKLLKYACLWSQYYPYRDECTIIIPLISKNETLSSWEMLALVACAMRQHFEGTWPPETIFLITPKCSFRDAIRLSEMYLKMIEKIWCEPPFQSVSSESCTSLINGRKTIWSVRRSNRPNFFMVGCACGLDRPGTLEKSWPEKRRHF